MRRLLLAAGVAVTLVAVPAGARAANYGSPGQLSALPNQEFNSATAPAYAAGGGFVAFRGTLGGQPGIYRRDQQTGAFALVASGDAAGPSISADGRFVAFTSSANLDPADDLPVDGGCSQVFVRDMAIPLGAPGATTLVSARDGASTGLTYAGCSGSYPNPPRDGSARLTIQGAQAALGSAISADGRSVAFTVLSKSDLGAAPGQASTDPGQVAVRRLDTDTTTLVTATPQGQPTSGGGAYPSTTSIADGATTFTDPSINTTSLPLSTAAISGDGTTVAWLGTNVPNQVPSATDVAPGMNRVGSGATMAQEVEPLWRRVADGVGATTKRLMTGAGLDFYTPALTFGDPVEGGTATQGQPLAPGTGPVLSADGSTAAVLASALTPQEESDYNSSRSSSPFPYEAYVLHVTDDSAAPQVTRLTQTADLLTGTGFDSVGQVALSPGGQYVAFDTGRNRFPLPTPTLITPPTAETAKAPTYVVDLARGTLELATSTFDGNPSNGPAGSLSLDAAGDLAVATTATNLVYGDQNPGQVFELPRIPLSTAVAAGSISPLPAAAVARPAIAPWTLGVRSIARRDGEASVQVTVPGAGRIRVRATAQLSSRPSKRATRRPGKSIAAQAVNQTKPKKPTKKKRRKPDKGVPVPSRTVATAARRVRGQTSVTITLRVTRRYRSLVRTGHGLYAVVGVTFSAAGHAALIEKVPVTFHRRKPPAHHRHRRRTTSHAR